MLGRVPALVSRVCVAETLVPQGTEGQRVAPASCLMQLT
jgi:hypothetical protein